MYSVQSCDQLIVHRKRTALTKVVQMDSGSRLCCVVPSWQLTTPPRSLEESYTLIQTKAALAAVRQNGGHQSGRYRQMLLLV